MKPCGENFFRVLNKYGITGQRAELSAALFADASRDGIYTHGLNRFPKFIKSIENGSVDVNAEAEKEASLGMLERWNGLKQNGKRPGMPGMPGHPSSAKRSMYSHSSKGCSDTGRRDCEVCQR